MATSSKKAVKPNVRKMTRKLSGDARRRRKLEREAEAAQTGKADKKKGKDDKKAKGKKGKKGVEVLLDLVWRYYSGRSSTYLLETNQIPHKPQTTVCGQTRSPI